MFWYRYGTGPSKESCFKPTKIGQGNFNDILIDVTKGNVVRVDSNSWKSASSASPPKNWTFSTGMEPVEPFTLWEQLQSWTFAKIGAPSTVVLVVQVLVAGDELPGNRCWISPLFPEKKKTRHSAKRPPSGNPSHDTIRYLSTPRSQNVDFSSLLSKICCIVSIITIQSPQKKCVK